MESESEAAVDVSRQAAWRGAYLLLIAVVLAYLEVQIEGPDGWASALPTWRTTDPSVTWILGGKPVTGYHAALITLLLLFLHWPCFFTRWSLVREIRVLQGFAVLAVIWDFLWFVLNPSFGIERYGPESVWWFKSWTLGVPTDYWIGAAAALALWVVPVVARRYPPRAALAEATVGLFVPLIGAAVLAVAVTAWQ